MRFPLLYQQERVGELAVSPRRRGETLDASERRLLADLARQAGVAVHAMRLTADLRRSRERLVLAREEERRRLRRTLHDEVGPSLTSLLLKLRAAVWQLDAPTPVAARLGAARPDAQAPNPAARDAQAGVAALLTDIERDAVSNVVRHARARSCQVSIALTTGAPRRGPAGLAIEVVDDGDGLPATSRPGVGLTSLRERAEEVGGSVRVESRAGRGTRVRALLPLVPAPEP